MNKPESLLIKHDNSPGHEVGKPAAYIDGEPENYEQKNLSNSMEEGVKKPTASQDRLPKDQINNQDSGEINNLRLEIASHKLSSIITIEEPSVNSDLAGKFNPKEIFSSGQEKFVGYLEKTNLRTLIGYIEMGGIKIKKVKELSLADKKSLTLLKKREKGVLLVNPRLYFLSKADAGLLATKELLKRLKVDKESKQSI